MARSEILQDFVIMERETHSDHDHHICHIIDIHNDDDFSSSSSLSTDTETSDSGRLSVGGATAHHEFYPPLTSDEGSSPCTIGWNSMEFVFTSVQIVAALVVWTLSKDEHPQALLLAWLIGYTCGCITGTLLLSWRKYSKVGEYPGTRLDRVMKELKIGLECFFVLWLIGGILWICFGQSSLSDAPNLYRLCITFIALSCIRFSVALLRLCADSEGEGQEGGFVFQGPINDDSCCICLEKFGERKRAIRKLECSHMFHLDCIESWLKVKGTCPLCQSSVV
ncbi:E3 ubiquitin-protein ligase At1g63170 isoform X1 [Raphanus sativus]|uniref:E3 ubiquitin-protein ligase At1g63170 isoform X1 n=1 Tax=Raphanus sativus TaxID=3726 RepID=A0A9W3C2B0_RAPSA|nr:E3 ubiquitin-protein ligase At1g63170 isoform X1 [Raphanus sativus]